VTEVDSGSQGSSADRRFPDLRRKLVDPRQSKLPDLGVARYRGTTHSGPIRRFRGKETLVGLLLGLAISWLVSNTNGIPGSSTVDVGSSETEIVPGAASVATSIGPPIAVTPATFWSLDLQTNNSSGIWSDGAVRSFLNATPFTWFRYGELTEECNISANVMYGPNGTPVGPCAYDLTALKSWCRSVSFACHLVLPLPAENNNPAEDAFIANWIVHTVGIRPQYWSIGNEPMLWRHYGIPWANWSVRDHSRPTPLAYARQLNATIQAVRAVDPGARFMGLEAASPNDLPWFTEVARLDRAGIAAIGYHSYPFTTSKNESLQQFLAPLQSPSNISTTYPLVQADVGSACPRCGSIPVFLHEFNAGPGNGASPFGGSYANAVFLAGSVVQALRANVTQFTVFNLQSDSSQFGYSLLNRTDAIAPTGRLFSEVLNHLVRGGVYSPVPAPSLGNVWSVLTRDATRGSLLIVNANLTGPVTIPTTSYLRVGSRVHEIAWNSSTPGPTNSTGSVSANYTIPAMGILLLSFSASALHAPAHGSVSPIRSSAGAGLSSAPVAASRRAGSRWVSAPPRTVG